MKRPEAKDFKVNGNILSFNWEAYNEALEKYCDYLESRSTISGEVTKKLVWPILTKYITTFSTGGANNAFRNLLLKQARDWFDKELSSIIKPIEIGDAVEFAEWRDAYLKEWNINSKVTLAEHKERLSMTTLQHYELFKQETWKIK